MRRIVSVVLVSCVFVMAFLLRVYPGPATVDDAYITLRMVNNIARGAGFVYNEGERVLSTTAPAYALTLAVPVSLGADAVRASLLLNGFSAALTAVLLVWIVLRLTGSLAVGLGAGCLFAVTPSSVLFSVAGMEAPFYTLLLIGGTCAFAAGYFNVAAILAGLLPWVRPDGAILSVILCFAILMKRRREAWRPAICFFSVFLPFLVCLWGYFGSPIPHSLMQKIRFFDLTTKFHAGFFGMIRQWIYHFYSFFYDDPLTAERIRNTEYLHLLLAALPFAAAVLVSSWKILRSRREFLPFALFAPFFVLSFSAGGAGIPWTWYFVPTDPFFIGLTVVGLFLMVSSVRAMFLDSTGDDSFPAVATAAFCLALAGTRLVTDYGSDLQLRCLPQHVPPWRERAYVEVSQFLNSLDAAPTSIVLCAEVGGVGYVSRYKVWDLDLTTPRSMWSTPPEIGRDYRPQFITFVGMFAMSDELATLPDEWVPREGCRYRKIYDNAEQLGGHDKRHTVVAYQLETASGSSGH